MARKGRKTSGAGDADEADAPLRSRREVCKPDSCGLAADGEYQSRTRGAVPLWSCKKCGYSTTGEDEAYRLNPELEPA